LSGELFQILTGINLPDVPYRGLSAGGYADLMAGIVQVAFDNLMGSIELVRAGKLKMLAVTTKSRAPAVPDVPSIGELWLDMRQARLVALALLEGRPPKSSTR
jgi:tripartite-type tricarboxylate transporter receptor subunit TctC